MKAVMISIQPKWCEKIASGEKTIEIRKTKPKCKTPFKCYIYMTKTRVTGAFADWDCAVTTSTGDMYYGGSKVIGEFVCDKIDDILYLGIDLTVNGVQDRDILETSCLSMDEIENYCGYVEYTKLYGWHISELKIYDKPKELSEFMTICKHYDDCLNECPYLTGVKGYEYDERGCAYDGYKPITRPPQSWCYVEEKE